MWTSGSDFFVAVAAGNNVWMWHEDSAAPAHSGWTPLGPVEPTSAPAPPTTGLVYLADGAAGQLFALRGSQLFARDPNSLSATWKPVKTTDSVNPATVIGLKRVAPIAVEAENLAGNLNEGLAGIDSNDVLYTVTFAGPDLDGTCTSLVTNVTPDLAPGAVRRTDTRLAAVAVRKDTPATKTLRAFLSTPGTLTNEETDRADLDWPETGGTLDLVGNSIDLNVCGGQLTFAVALKSGGASAVATWAPQFSPTADTVAYIF